MQVAARNHRQLALLEEKLGDLQRSQMEAKAAERARDAKTQQILLGAMYASSKEAATEQLNKADNLRVSLQGCMQGEFQAGALSRCTAAVAFVCLCCVSSCVAVAFVCLCCMSSCVCVVFVWLCCVSSCVTVVVQRL